VEIDEDDDDESNDMGELGGEVVQELRHHV
jgi:hypothetical protein